MDVFKAMNDAREGSIFTDLTITCQGEIFEVHRVVVCTQSGFFSEVSRPGSSFEARETQQNLARRYDANTCLKRLTKWRLSNPRRKYWTCLRSDRSSFGSSLISSMEWTGSNRKRTRSWLRTRINAVRGLGISERCYDMVRRLDVHV